MNWLAPEFDCWRNWISQQRNNEMDWDAIAVGGNPEDDLVTWIRGMERFNRWPPLGDSDAERESVWKMIVGQKREWEEASARQGRIPVVIGREGQERELRVPTDDRSSWALYKRHVSRKLKVGAVETLESSSFRILKRLRYQTAQPDHAVKGMVVGHVQSGKTASMAGLMAMAADWNWNLVIVLTGTIENLRLQTESRLVKDLNHPGNLYWSRIEHPGPNSGNGHRAQDLQLNENSTQRYLVVTLKNSTRLQNLLGWLRGDAASLALMRILIIDDEADQASVDSSPARQAERNAINQSIISLTKIEAAAVNYVAYTATPYANFLNEAWPDSLYPQDFIVALPQPDEHFGPKQVFGIDESESQGGLGIVREIPQDDIEGVRALHKDDGAPLVASLTDAICWFLCGAAAIRVHGDILEPVSMLIHTSALQDHHQNVANAVQAFLANAGRPDRQKAVLSKCRDLWTQEGAKLTLGMFQEKWPDYGSVAELRDYPAFDVMLPHLQHLLERYSHIPMREERGQQRPEYHKGVHLCIDNCANNGVNDENEHVRLRYPSEDECKTLGCAAAFIIVGGSTLSRGLTIENLISTFFLRSGAQMDTLMQMGRWFGFRRKYELIPRIWMPKDTKEKFVFMAGVESELREDLARFMDQGASPRDYGPRVKTHPKASWLRPTAKNRMQAAKGAEYDYSGVNRQTTIFSRMPEDLAKNLEVTEAFLTKLGAPVRSPSSNAAVWRGVAFEDVAEFLRGFRFQGRLRFFSELEPFLGWLASNKERFQAWNVVAAGPDEAGCGDKEPWVVGDMPLSRIRRTALKGGSDAQSVSIGALRDPRHLGADSLEALSLPQGASNSEVAKARAANSLGGTPQLLLYRVDGSSTVDKSGKPNGKSETREDLNLPVDAIGISVWIPEGNAAGGRRKYATHLTVRIPPELISQDDDASEDPAVVSQ